MNEEEEAVAAHIRARSEAAALAHIRLDLTIWRQKRAEGRNEVVAWLETHGEGLMEGSLLLRLKKWVAEKELLA